MSNHAPVPQLSPELCAAARDPAARLRQAESSIAALRALLDALGPALVLVDGAGRLVFMNRRAAQILARRDGLAIVRNGLTTGSMRATRSLRDAIASVAAQAHSLRRRPLTVRLAVTRPSARPPWLVSILPVAQDGAGAAPAGLAAVRIESDVRPPIDPASAADYFLLTPREADVAAVLASGRGSREAAKALHIRIGTVRTHLKSLFAKTGARSQTALALKLQAFAIRD